MGRIHAHEPLAIRRPSIYPLGEELGCADRCHAALPRGLDILATELAAHEVGGERFAGQPPEEETAHRLRMPDRERQGQHSPRGAAADESGPRAHPGEQLGDVIRPDLPFGLIALNDDAAAALVSPAFASNSYTIDQEHSTVSFTIQQMKWAKY